MKPNFQSIDDQRVQQLAVEIYDVLLVTENVTFFEILSNDIYCQIGDKESFVFSVEVRGDDAEFFLFDMNFILSKSDDFEIFKRNVLTVVKSSLSGDYEIEIVKFNRLKLSSTLIFQKKLRVLLYENLLISFFAVFKSRLTKYVKKGRAIM